MTIAEIVSTVNPNATKEDMEYIVWTRTPFPFGILSVKILYEETSRYFRAKKNNIRLCDFCDNIAMSGDIVCKKCDNLLKNGALAER